MLETRNDSLHFSFPEIHPDAQVTIEFQRTLRIPDDHNNHKLPPGLGRFPIRHIDDHPDRVPLDWQQRGGVMLPMYQSEALWVKFSPHRISNRPGATCYPFAIRVAAGQRSAITGDKWHKKLHEKDYVTVPKQPWIDGFVVKKGVIKQFVAMPLGEGFTAEEQLTGKAEFGGIQIEVFPMKLKALDRRFPYHEPVAREISDRGILRSRGFGRRRSKTTFGAQGIPKGAQGASRGTNYSADSLRLSDSDSRCDWSGQPDMGLGAGGSMKQEIFDDPFAFEDWKKKHIEGNRCYVHLANTIAWRAITTEQPPTKPPTAADYSRHGYPWFDYYDDGPKLKGTDKLKGLKSVLELGFQKGMGHVLPENESVNPHRVKVVSAKGGAVRQEAFTK